MKDRSKFGNAATEMPRLRFCDVRLCRIVQRFFCLELLHKLRLYRYREIQVLAKAFSHTSLLCLA